MPARTFIITGMDCAEEVTTLKQALGSLVGGEDQLSFNILQATMTVSSAAGTVTTETIQSAVARTGMKATLQGSAGGSQDTASPPVGLSRVHLTLLSGGCLVLGFISHAAMQGVVAALGNEGLSAALVGVPWGARLIYLVGIAAGLWVVLPKAWYALRSLRPDMNLLMVVAVTGAIAINQWLEGATVAFLFAVSLLLESWSIGRARRAVEALMAGSPTVVRVRSSDGTESERAVNEVAVGTRIIIRPGEKIPLDGVVRSGQSDVNQAPITGESRPVSKEAGEEVFAGTLNGDGVLEVETTKPADQTLLANIIRLVGEAQSNKAPSEQWVERFARIYTPVVMALAILVLLVPPLLLHGAWDAWFYRALVLLVIACPCALVISTPVSIVAALASAAQHGALVKGGVHIETPAGLVAIAMDKTGTITQGTTRVVDVIPLTGQTEGELLAVAAALEMHSTHPLARAILHEASIRKIDAVAAQEIQELKGKGVHGVVAGVPCWLGSHRYLEDERAGETPEIHTMLEQLEASGKSLVVVGSEHVISGLISVADVVRPDAARTITALRQLGVQHIVMLSGDNRGTAEAIAHSVGIDEVRAELLPAEKVEAIEALMKKYGRVAMIGDGINDAPALAQASLGIAMGAVGSDAAIEAADIALMADNLALLPWLIEHSRRTLRIIQQNIVFSLAVKAVFVVLTAIGGASLWAAIMADMVASLLVIANGLRLLSGPAPLAALSSDAPQAIQGTQP